MNGPPDGRDGEVLHVLVVEDHAQVRQFLEIVLANAGYRVTAAENGDEARRLIEQGTSADLLLSDIRMPGTLDGVELARWAQVYRPGMAILLQTGYSEVKVEDFRVLQKPYAPEVLLDTVRREIERVRRSARGSQHGARLA